MRRSFLRKLLLGFLLCGIIVITLFYHQKQFRPPRYVLNHPYINYDVEKQEALNEDQDCILPRIHPFDNSIISYLWDSKPIYCKSRQQILTFIDENGFLRFNDTALDSAGYSKSSLHCVYWPILRKAGGDDFVAHGDQVVVTGNDALPIYVDFIEVSCRNFIGYSVYNNIHGHIRNISRPKKQLDDSYNVFIFGLDSMSRLSFMRLLPNTYRYLTEEMKSFLFRGMNKVGDNTFPNLVAMVTGKRAYGDLPHPPKIKHYDGWPCIWKNYSDSGYITLFAEDFPEYALFNYLSTGFKDPPTDYYLRPFWLAVENSRLLRMSSHMCYGEKPKYQLQLDYVVEFLKKYRNSKYFAFSFLAEVSHEYMSQVAGADNDFVTFLRYIFENGHLNRTVFLFMSDHGHRFDPIRETLVGSIEERMPFYTLYVPESLTQKQPHILSHLHINTARLVTHFDTYDTLIDVLNFSNEGTQLGTSVSRYGRSLFGPIDGNRTCPEAGIPDHYCTCEHEGPMLISNPAVQKGALAIIAEVNIIIEKELEDQSNLCAHLKVSQIKSAHQVSPYLNFLENSSTNKTGSDVKEKTLRIRIIVQASPGNGVFESTVSVTNGDIHVLGDISRINKYEGQYSCIKHTLLRKYCYCIK